MTSRASVLVGQPHPQKASCLFMATGVVVVVHAFGVIPKRASRMTPRAFPFRNALFEEVFFVLPQTTTTTSPSKSQVLEVGRLANLFNFQSLTMLVSITVHASYLRFTLSPRQSLSAVVLRRGKVDHCALGCPDYGTYVQNLALQIEYCSLGCLKPKCSKLQNVIETSKFCG